RNSPTYEGEQDCKLAVLWDVLFSEEVLANAAIGFESLETILNYLEDLDKESGYKGISWHRARPMPDWLKRRGILLLCRSRFSGAARLLLAQFRQNACYSRIRSRIR